MVNLAKSAALPIRCSAEELDAVCTSLDFTKASFPCNYIGLPLSIRKATPAQFQYLVEKFANRLPNWKAATLPKSGRLILILSVLCAIPIHAMLAMNIPPKTLTALTKICRGFLCCGKMDARGGSWAVAWDLVCRPRWVGGLGIPNLRWLNIAMMARWSWLQRTDHTRPWADFQIAIPAESRALFRTATTASVGHGQDTRFWEDKWIDGYRVQDLAPMLYSKVSRQARSSRTIAEALTNHAWAADFGPELTADMLRQFLGLWQRVEGLALREDAPDKIRWAWEKDGMFSA